MLTFAAFYTNSCKCIIKGMFQIEFHRNKYLIVDEVGCLAKPQSPHSLPLLALLASGLFMNFYEIDECNVSNIGFL